MGSAGESAGEGEAVRRERSSRGDGGGVRGAMGSAGEGEAALLEAVRLERSSDGGGAGASGRSFLWRGSGAGGGSHIFGGVLLAQAAAAAMAASGADGERHGHVHAMHCRFLAAGDARGEVGYSCRRLRGGGSFSAYRVDAFQGARMLFTANVSLTSPGGGGGAALDAISHVARMPSLPGKSREEMPTVLESLLGLLRGRGPRARGQLGGRVLRAELWREMGVNGFPAVEIKFVDPLVAEAWTSGSAYLQRGGPGAGRSGAAAAAAAAGAAAAGGKTRQHFWARVRPDLVAPLGSDHRVATALLAFMTDMYLIETALHKVGLMLGNEYIDPLSLDHAVYFHGREPDGGEGGGAGWALDDWILMELEVITVRNGRTLCTGKAFAERGDHICTCIQEGLLRARARL